MIADQTTERKFTPGPWGIDRGFRDAGTAPGPHYTIPDGFLTVYMGDAEDDYADADYATVHGRNQEANANLIAAAPDLLEACIEAEKYIADTTPDGLGDMLRVAIAKAEGRS